MFIVDNSDSIRGDRFKSAVSELTRCIEQLSVREAFYVIFVSDQTYPMFFPSSLSEMVPAAAFNKERLAEWVPNAITASGKNRELINAMNMASDLRPEAVFFL